MSLLERFGIVFDSNAVDATKDNEKLAKSFDAVEKAAKDATKGTEANTKAVDAGNKSLAKKSLTLGALTRRFLGIAAAIKIANIALTNLNKTSSVGRLASDLGLNPSQIEKFAITSGRLGGSPEATRATIANLRTSIEGLSLGQNIDLFKKLQFAGGSVFDAEGNKKDPFEIFKEIGVFLKTLSPERALQRGQNAGLDIGLIRLLLSDTEKELLITEELGTITKEQTAATQKLAETMAKVGQIWDTIVRESLHPLVPAINTLATNFLEFSKTIRAVLPSLFGDDEPGFIDSLVGTSMTPEGAPQWFKDLLETREERAVNAAKSLENSRNRTQEPFNIKFFDDWLKRTLGEPTQGRQGVAPGTPALGPGASNAVTNNNQQASSSVHIDQINVDAGGNANAADIGANVGSEIQTNLAAVNAQYSSGVLA